MQKTIKKVSLGAEEPQYEYWSKRTFQERLNAIEILRQQYISFKNVKPGLQRVYRVIKQK
ncbi:MAG: hypothetical protein AAF149_14100 [Bacteroidota bacterium]